MIIQPMKASLPIFAGTITRNTENPRAWKFDSKHLMGTAFKIGEGIFMTAAHVVKDALEKGDLAMFYLNSEGKAKAAIVLDYEVNYEHDVAFLKAEIPDIVCFKWSFDDVYAMVDVKAMGYPFALDIENSSYTIRGQKGHIVSDCQYPLYKDSKPKVYELSFPVFSGMSGAALLFPNKVDARIVGVCLGNRTTTMKVFDSREIIESENKKEIYETHYAYTLGLAIKSNSIAHLTSKLFNGTLFEFVEK